MRRSKLRQCLLAPLWLEASEEPQAEVIVEEPDLHRVVVRRLLGLRAAIDDDLVQHRDLGPDPVRAGEPLQIARVIDQDLVYEPPLVLAEWNYLGSLVCHRRVSSLVVDVPVPAVQVAAV